MRDIVITSVLGLLCSLPAIAAEFPRFQAQEIDPRAGEVCYAVTTADVNGDGKLDVVVVTENAVIWYENPKWNRQEAREGRLSRPAKRGRRSTGRAIVGQRRAPGGRRQRGQGRENDQRNEHNDPN